MGPRAGLGVSEKRNSLAPTEFRTPDRPARNEPLHPLSHQISTSQRGEELPQPQPMNISPHTGCSGIYILLCKRRRIAPATTDEYFITYRVFWYLHPTLHSPQYGRGLDVQALWPILVPEGLFFRCIIVPAIRFEVSAVQVHRQTWRFDSSHGHTNRMPGHAVGHLHTDSAAVRYRSDYTGEKDSWA